MNTTPRLLFVIERDWNRTQTGIDLIEWEIECECAMKFAFARSLIFGHWMNPISLRCVQFLIRKRKPSSVISAHILRLISLRVWRNEDWPIETRDWSVIKVCAKDNERRCVNERRFWTPWSVIREQADRSSSIKRGQERPITDKLASLISEQFSMRSFLNDGYCWTNWIKPSSVIDIERR